MLKKLCIALSAMLISVSAVYAEGDIKGVITDDKIVFSDIKGEVLVLNGYNDGKLIYSQRFENNGKIEVPLFEAELIKGIDSAVNEAVEVVLEKAPEATPVPEEPTATPEPTQKPLFPWKDSPEVYGSEKNAYYAPSVIEEVSSKIQDGVEGYEIKCLFLGKELTLFADNEVKISAANDTNSALIDQSPLNLRKGDVVFIDREMSGEVRTIGLICKAPSASLLLDGNDYGLNFEKYIAQNGRVANAASWGVVNHLSGTTKADYQYAFGLVGRRNGTQLYLMNSTASIDNALELALHEDSVVYVYDMADRSNVSVEKISSIPSCIPKTQWNGGGTVVYDEDNTFAYALVRIVEGVATDIILYITD